jgi:hypothetical protein
MSIISNHIKRTILKEELTMTVRDLIDVLENFDEDMEVHIGMIQNYGSNFAMNIVEDVAEYKIRSYYGDDFKAVVLTEGDQIGVVDYDGEEEEEE